MYYTVTRDENDTPKDDRDDADDEADGGKRRGREDAPKERVLHTRVPAVLDQELKRLAQSLRVPVSNVVRAILEDALDAVDSVGERAQGGILGFADRIARQRDELRSRMRGHEDREAHAAEGRTGPAREVSGSGEASPANEACPSTRPELLDGVFGYQPLVLATDSACTVCGRALAAGQSAHRALFDDPGKRVFLGPDCRLLPEKGS